MNKCKTSASSSIQESGLEAGGGEPPPNLKVQSREDGTETVEDDLGDLEIMKSPSDPKKYR